jgi:general secretion pathway protein M
LFLKTNVTQWLSFRLHHEPIKHLSMTPALIEKWTLMSKRERVMVTLAFVVVLVGLIIGLGIDPALRGIKRTEKELPELRRDVATVRAYTEEARQLSNTRNAVATASANVRDDLAKSLTRAGLSDTVKLSGAGSSLSLQVQAAPFAALLDWLNAVPRELPVKVSQLKLNRTAVAGTVSGDLVIETSAR